MSLVFRALLLALAVAAPASADVTDRFVRTFAPAPGTPIDIQITVGRVQLSGWDRSDVSVEIVRRAPDERQLARIPVEAEHTSEALTIRALQADGGRDARLRSDIVIRVPAAAVVRRLEAFEGGLELSGLRGACTARMERGDIVGRDISGTIRLETAMGHIRLERASLAADGLLRLRTFNGDVALELAAVPVDARILALSLGGTVSSAIPLTMQDRWGPRFGEATLGKGEPVISIDAVNGDVSITIGASAR